MAFNDIERKRIQIALDAWVEQKRPPPQVRHQVDIGYTIEKQSIIIHEDRVNMHNKWFVLPVAKLTFIKVHRVWRIFWMRGDLKWHSYQATPEVDTLEQALDCISQDTYGCFWG
ncbi:DUF3024 domain-containing protein [Orrella sp. 11846]|uniref:DUF3024 domain-containing protein n=1 Tax=Orrella sp. 11846 TaxID=3409913 RepID=UPI003B5C74DC